MRPVNRCRPTRLPPVASPRPCIRPVDSDYCLGVPAPSEATHCSRGYMLANPARSPVEKPDARTDRSSRRASAVEPVLTMLVVAAITDPISLEWANPRECIISWMMSRPGDVRARSVNHQRRGRGGCDVRPRQRYVTQRDCWPDSSRDQHAARRPHRALLTTTHLPSTCDGKESLMVAWPRCEGSPTFPCQVASSAVSVVPQCSDTRLHHTHISSSIREPTPSDSFWSSARPSSRMRMRMCLDRASMPTLT